MVPSVVCGSCYVDGGIYPAKDMAEADGRQCVTTSLLGSKWRRRVPRAWADGGSHTLPPRLVERTPWGGGCAACSWFPDPRPNSNPTLVHRHPVPLRSQAAECAVGVPYVQFQAKQEEGRKLKREYHADPPRRPCSPRHRHRPMAANWHPVRAAFQGRSSRPATAANDINPNGAKHVVCAIFDKVSILQVPKQFERHNQLVPHDTVPKWLPQAASSTDGSLLCSSLVKFVTFLLLARRVDPEFWIS